MMTPLAASNRAIHLIEEENSTILPNSKAAGDVRYAENGALLPRCTTSQQKTAQR